MLWTEEDTDKLATQLEEVILTSRKLAALQRLVDLIADTLLIYGCPVEEVSIILKLNAFANFCQLTGLKRKLGGSRKRAGFMADVLAEWVGETISGSAG
jgi:hypothetical protein